MKMPREGAGTAANVASIAPEITFNAALTDARLKEGASKSIATLLARAEAAAGQRLNAIALSNKIKDRLTVTGVLEPEISYFKSLGNVLPLDLDIKNIEAGRPKIRVPPYDFHWSWLAPGSDIADFVLANKDDGQAHVRATSGGAQPDHHYVEVHAGVGLVLTTDTPAMVTGRCFKLINFKHNESAVGISSDAVSEGGIELTALEDGNLITFASHRLWRSRVATSLFTHEEKASDEQGSHHEPEPRELSFHMSPGKVYTFNAGVWLRTNRSDGIGAAGASAFIDGHFLALTLERK